MCKNFKVYYFFNLIIKSQFQVHWGYHRPPHFHKIPPTQASQTSVCMRRDLLKHRLPTPFPEFDLAGLRIYMFNKFAGHASAAGPWSWLWISLLYIQLLCRERCQGDLQGHLRRSDIYSIFKCDAWIPWVMGKMYSFCSVVLNHRRTCPEAPRAEALLCVAYVCGWCWLSMFTALPCLCIALLLHILVADSCFYASCLKQCFAFMEDGYLQAHQNEAACLGPPGLRDTKHWWGVC